MFVRLMALLAVMMLLGGAQAEGLLCINGGGQAALLTADGQAIVSPGAYAAAFALTEDRYALGIEGESGLRYAMCDEGGALLTAAEYGMLAASQDVILFAQDGLFGAMDFDGNVLLPAQYTRLVRAGDGYLAMNGNTNDGEADEIFVVGASGEAVSTGVFSAIPLEALADGRTAFQDPYTEKYGYLDERGSTVIPAQYETAGGFKNGLARATEGGKVGAIGTDGAWRILPEYDFLEIGANAAVGLIGRETFVILDGQQREVARVEGAGLECALAGDNPILLADDQMTVFTAHGDVLLELDRQDTVSPGLDGWLILADGAWGEACMSLVSPAGVRNERRDQHLLPLGDGRYAFVRMNTARYFSEALDEIRLSCDYDSLRLGMIDETGREILPAEYLEISALGQDRFLTLAADGLRVVDGEGNVLWAHVEEQNEAASEKIR